MDLTRAGLLQDTLCNAGLATSSALLYPKKVVFSDGMYLVGGIDDIDEKLFIAKLDYTGHFQWASSIEHDSEQVNFVAGVTASNRGGIYLAYTTFGGSAVRVGRFVDGSYDWVRELNPSGVGDVTSITPNYLTRNSSDDVFIALSADSFGEGMGISLAAADGATQFARQFHETGAATATMCCAARNRPTSGYVVGGILGEGGYFLSTLTSAGLLTDTVALSAVVGGFTQGVRDIAVASTGDIYALAQYGSGEMRVLKFNSSLVLQWTRSYPTLTPVQITAIDDDDSVVVLATDTTNRWFLKLAADGTAGTQRTMDMNSTGQGSALGSMNGNQILLVDSSSTTVEASVNRGAPDGSDLLFGNGVTWGTTSLTQTTPATTTSTPPMTESALTVANSAETDTSVSNITTSEFIAPTRFGG